MKKFSLFIIAFCSTVYYITFLSYCHRLNLVIKENVSQGEREAANRTATNEKWKRITRTLDYILERIETLSFVRNLIILMAFHYIGVGGKNG